MVGSTLAMVLRTLLLMIGGIVMLAITSPALTGLVLLGVPFVILPAWLLGHRVRRLSRDSQDRIADVGAYVDEVLHGIRTVQACCHEPIDRRALRRAQVESAFEVAVRRSQTRRPAGGGVDSSTFGAIGVVLWIGGRQVLAGAISGGELSAFLFYAVVVASSVGCLSELMGELLRGAGASERLMELLATEPRIRPARPRPCRPRRGAGRVRAVRFAYPARPDPGAATTSIPGHRAGRAGGPGRALRRRQVDALPALLRFYDPRQGRIRFDGVALTDLDPPSCAGASRWSRRIRSSSAPTPGRTSVTVSTACRTPPCAPRPMRPTRASFSTGCRRASTPSSASAGSRLSGGQRQRIAIARALLRDPALLLFDEATSALDAESERLVQLALERLMHGRTSMVIAHRLATVRQVDRILVLDQGRVVASGRHDSLMGEDGLYARLAALQFRG